MTKSRKRKGTGEEIANDPTLRWNPYRWGEQLFSDKHGDFRRFVGYAPDGRILLASLNGIAPETEPVDPLRVRRPTPGPGKTGGTV